MLHYCELRLLSSLLMLHSIHNSRLLRQYNILVESHTLLPLMSSQVTHRCNTKEMLSLPVRGFMCRIPWFSSNIARHQTRFYSLPKMTSENSWNAEKKRILSLPLEEKRKLYKTKEFVPKVDSWVKYYNKNEGIAAKKPTLEDVTEYKKDKFNPDKNKALAECVSIFKGDITTLEIDAIVNAANSRLVAGGGVDGAIHRAAGPLLQKECNTLGGCPIGEAKVTGAYNLPAKYVIHTVGPQDGSAAKLQSCYEKCLVYHKELHINTIAFPCISTGIYGFPNRLAAHIALRTARKFLEDNDSMKRIIFCTFLPIDVEIYETLMQMYFPIHERRYNDGASTTE